MEQSKRELKLTIRASMIGVLMGLVAWPVIAEEKPAAESPWQLVKTPTEATLRGLHAVGDGVVWVTGSEGTSLRTLDNGETWQAIAPKGSKTWEIRDVEAFSGKSVLLQVAGQPANIYRTRDGGKSFKAVYKSSKQSAFFDGMAFWPERNRIRGVAFSDPVDGEFLVITTTNSGATWQELPGHRLPEPKEGEAGFAASGTGVAVAAGGSGWIGLGGPSARILRTENYGQNWRAVNTPLRSGNESSGVFSIAFRDSQNGLATGGDYRDEEGLQGTLAVSRDGGKSWQEAKGLSGFRSCVVWIPRDDGDSGIWVAAGPSGVDMSADDANTWSVLGDQGFHVLSVSPDGELWAAGSDGRVARLKSSALK